MHTFNAHVGVFEIGVKISRRIWFPIWSNAWVTYQMATISPVDSCVCMGHTLKAIHMEDRRVLSILRLAGVQV